MITIADVFGNSKEVEYEGNLLEFLKSENLTSSATHVYFNFVELHAFDMDVKSGDNVYIINQPQGSVSTALAYIGKLALSAAVSYAVGKLFEPDMPSLTNPMGDGALNTSKDSPSYSLNSQQNEAKRGEPIPLVYGVPRLWFPLIAPPYYRYEDGEEFLYQLMCIGHNKLHIDRLFLSDTPIGDIPSSSFEYRIFTEDNFGDIPTYFDNYQELVKTLPDPNNLEVRGAPSHQTYNVSFEDGNAIHFYPFDSGVIPDLTALQSGSTIEVNGTVHNDGVFTVDLVENIGTEDQRVVTVETTVLEPNVDSGMCILTGNPWTTFMTNGDNFTVVGLDWFEGLVFDENYYVGNTYKIHMKNPIGDDGNSLPDTTFEGEVIEAYLIDYDLILTFNITNPFGIDGHVNNNFTDCNVILLSKNGSVVPIEAGMTFETSYGPYRFDETTREGRDMTHFEIDVNFPNGVYEIDTTSGDYIDHTIEFQFTLCHVDLDGNLLGCVEKVESITSNETSSIRQTYRYSTSDLPYANVVGKYYVQIKRITPESDSNYVYDRMYVSRVKGLYGFSNFNWGDITVMLARVKASNAISSLSQFNINGFVGAPQTTLSDVVKDLYSNDVYGGSMDVNDVIIVDGDADSVEVDCVFSSRLTVFDAIQTLCKANGFFAYPVGTKMYIRKDKAQDVVKFIYNETNIVKGSLNVSYLFRDVEQDCVEVRYFDKNSMWAQLSQRFPDTGMKPESYDLLGVTTEAKALEIAKLTYNRKVYQKKQIEFKTDIQGWIPQYLDKVMIVLEMTKWGYSGFIQAFNDRVITLDCDFGVIDPSNTDGYDTIIFRNKAGIPSQPYTFTITGVGVITLNEDPPTWLYVGDAYDNTSYALGIGTAVEQYYTVVGVKPYDEQVSITCINYDAAIYS